MESKPDPQPDTPKPEEAPGVSAKPDADLTDSLVGTPKPEEAPGDSTKMDGNQNDSKEEIEKTENKIIREYEAAESLRIMKAKTGYEMVDTISREDSRPVKIIYMTNKQAIEISKNSDAIDRMKEAFCGKTHRYLIIDLVQSWGFYNSTKIMSEGNYGQKWNAGIGYETPPFKDLKEEHETINQINQFMINVIIPLAEKTSAIVLYNAIVGDCILAECFTNVVEMMSSKWDDDPPFAAIGTLGSLDTLFSNKNESATWIKIREKCDGWKKRHEFFLKTLSECEKYTSKGYNHDLSWKSRNLLIVEGFDTKFSKEKISGEKNRAPFSLLMSSLMRRIGRDAPQLAIKTGACTRDDHVQRMHSTGIQQMSYRMLIERANANASIVCIDVRKRPDKYLIKKSEKRNEGDEQGKFDEITEDIQKEFSKFESGKIGCETLDCCMLAYLHRLLCVQHAIDSSLPDEDSHLFTAGITTKHIESVYENDTESKEEKRRSKETTKDTKNNNNTTSKGDNTKKGKIASKDEKGGNTKTTKGSIEVEYIKNVTNTASNDDNKKNNNGAASKDDNTKNSKSTASNDDNTKKGETSSNDDDAKPKKTNPRPDSLDVRIKEMEEKKKTARYQNFIHKKLNIDHAKYANMFAWEFYKHLPTDSTHTAEHTPIDDRNAEDALRKHFSGEIQTTASFAMQLLMYRRFYNINIWDDLLEQACQIDQIVLKGTETEPTLEGLKLLKKAWDEVDTTRELATFYKTFSNWLFGLQLFLGLLITVLSVIVGYKILPEVRFLILWISLLLGAIVTVDTIFSPRSYRYQLRLAQVKLESIIWKYRTRVGQFEVDQTNANQNRPEEKLSLALEEWSEQLTSGAKNPSATGVHGNWKRVFGRKKPSATSSKVSDGGDDHYSFLDGKAYIKFRIQDKDVGLLDQYKAPIPKGPIRQYKWNIVIVLIGVVIAVVSEHMKDEWGGTEEWGGAIVAILAAFIALFTSLIEYSDAVNQADMLTDAIQECGHQVNKWTKLNRFMTQSRDTTIDLVEGVESIVLQVMTSWSTTITKMSGMPTPDEISNDALSKRDVQGQMNVQDP